MNSILDLISKNGLVFAFLLVGVLMWLSYAFSKHVLNNKIPGAAIAIAAGLGLAYLGGEKGIASIPLFAGMAVLGGSMMRDFAIVATAMGANFREIKQAGWGRKSILIGRNYGSLFCRRKYRLCLRLYRCQKLHDHWSWSLYLYSGTRNGISYWCLLRCDSHQHRCRGHQKHRCYYCYADIC